MTERPTGVAEDGEGADIGDDDDEMTTPSMPMLTWRMGLQAFFGFALAILLIAVGLPFMTNTTWKAIGHHLNLVGPRASFEMFGIMLLGLAAYTFTLTAAIPGLSHVKASIINVSGSAVSNILPGGGAVGMASTYLMLRSWGFKRRNISTGLIVSGLWNVLARIALPLIGIAAVSSQTEAMPTIVRRAVWWGGVTGLLLLIAFAFILTSPRWTAWLGDQVDSRFGHLLARLRRGEAKGQPIGIKHLMLDQRARISTVTKHGWFGMTFGVAGQLGIWFILFWRAMAAVHVDLPIAELFAAYAIGRLMTAIPITPGGLGFTELAVVGVLVAWGANSAAALAGALIFALFTHVAEIPLGAVGWLAWLTSPKVSLTSKPLPS
ncbi:lysylphosphatidylglycerol synthase transmembrane domain-containing protein [Rudaeicoccus suwonensis]|uniref:Uncharacterized membrane protein YbhN (UPF0104 family) n=1 Tax=Rudaeicoccus suwonensis TaxID=657409 RepID=A0A561E8H5_9MICO|nr:lysylphosphatidylglycerol synthase transmembrane domain-containing protein [Rudaeicoccus suwonensis]TWE11914.1 uncharacterized membrane protein YbhN (UPF0104 family) [Rudaeicoccus suwonensis]